MAGYRIDFLFYEDLEVILSMIESDSFAESPESVSWLQRYLLKCRLKNLRLAQARNSRKHSRLQVGFSVILHPKTARKHSAFDYELILLKSKLKELVQLIKEKNLITEFSGDSFFCSTQNPHATRRTKIVLGEASLEYGDPFLACHL